jgi:hypothetical protein
LLSLREKDGLSMGFEHNRVLRGGFVFEKFTHFRSLDGFLTLEIYVLYDRVRIAQLGAASAQPPRAAAHARERKLGKRVTLSENPPL